MPVRLLQYRQRLLLRGRRQLAVGSASPQAMHHRRVAPLLHALQHLAHPALAHLHLLRRFPLRHLFVAGSLQPVQPVPFLLAHPDSFHPSALRLSIGTFYFAQLGTSHFAATLLRNTSMRAPGTWYSHALRRAGLLRRLADPEHMRA